VTGDRNGGTAQSRIVQCRAELPQLRECVRGERGRVEFEVDLVEIDGGLRLVAGDDIIVIRQCQAARVLQPVCQASRRAFTQSLGSVSVRDGVRVVAISPGPVATERLVNLMRKKAQDRTGNAENWRDLLKPLPFERAATAEEIGAAIAFLASEHSGYTSGSVAIIDAGLSARARSF
jgi:NAD(P)-dependent dehydrogenase (short-subunit alcohol dehydrogenase family)